MIEWFTDLHWIPQGIILLALLGIGVQAVIYGLYALVFVFAVAVVVLVGIAALVYLLVEKAVSWTNDR